MLYQSLLKGARRLLGLTRQEERPAVLLPLRRSFGIRPRNSRTPGSAHPQNHTPTPHFSFSVVLASAWTEAQFRYSGCRPPVVCRSKCRRSAPRSLAPMSAVWEPIDTMSTGGLDRGVQRYLVKRRSTRTHRDLVPPSHVNG